MSEYEEWLLDGDVDSAVALLRRLAAQVTRASSVPPPQGFPRWTDEAVDELLVEIVDNKGGVAFLLGAWASVDFRGSAERSCWRRWRTSWAVEVRYRRAL